MDIDNLTIGQARQIAQMVVPIIAPVPQHETGQQAERAVLVTTVHRGVFFGYATDTSGTAIRLKRARNCIYWSADVKGFLGLAAGGPTASCRIGPPADIELRDVTCVAAVGDNAVKAWEAAPWNS